MQNNQLNNVDVNNTRRSRAKFALHHDVNTTAAIGTMQPLLTQFMEANEKVNFSHNALLRANALVAPAWLKLMAKTWNCFVPIASIFPNEDYLLTRTAKQSSQGKFIPNSYPYISRAQLTALTLVGAKYSVWISDTESNNPDVWYKGTLGKDSTSSDIPEVDSRTLYNAIKGGAMLSTGECPSFGLTNHWRMNLSFMYKSDNGWVNQSSVVGDAFVPAGNDLETGVFGNVDINPSTADVVCIFGNPGSSVAPWKNRRYAVCFKWSTAGSLFAKMLRGFGIRLDIRAIDEKVSMLPLLAWYRAYFNFHGVERLRNWESTFCHRLIHEITEYNKADFMVGQGHLPVNEHWNVPNSVFWQFVVYELYQSFYPVNNYDFVSAHREHVTERDPMSTSQGYQGFTSAAFLTDCNIAMHAINRKGPFTDSANDDMSTGNASKKFTLNNEVWSTTDLEGIKSVLSSSSGISADALEALKRLSRMSNKHDVLGQNVRSLLRALGYGSYCDDSPVEYAGYREMPLNVTEVTATADTWDSVTKDGRFAGEQVGKSVTSSDEESKSDFSGHMEYSADCRGYFISMFAIVPEAGYVNMEDPHNKMLKPDEFYQKEFDGLGFEASSKESLFGDTPVASKADIKDHYFGVVPRFTSLKVKSNLMNGDFKRGSTRTSILPFSGDKIVRFRDVGVSAPEQFAGKHSYGITFSQASTDYATIPVAGEKWAYAYRFGFLGQLNRSFVSFDEVLEGRTDHTYLPLNYDEWTFAMNDNFICHFRNDFTLSSEMLPTANCYRTADDEAPANDTMDLS